MALRDIGFFLLLGVLVSCSSSDPPAAGPPDASQQPILKVDEDEIPCPPRAVLQTVCQQCHTRPQRNGAPFALINRSDILNVYEGAVIRDLMIQVLDARKMPLAPVTIEDDQRDTLLGWLRSGAPNVPPTTCDDA